MKCPACEHEAPQADFGEPLRCPDCGSYYAKAIASKQRAALERAREINAPGRKGAFLAADHVETSLRGINGVQPVAIVEVQLRFWAVVRLMVVLAFASIPAIFIVGTLIAGMQMLFGISYR